MTLLSPLVVTALVVAAVLVFYGRHARRREAERRARVTAQVWRAGSEETRRSARQYVDDAELRRDQEAMANTFLEWTSSLPSYADWTGDDE